MRRIVLAAVLVSACGGGAQTFRVAGPAPVLDVAAGGTLQLTAALTDGSGKSLALPGPVEWTSSDPSVASIDPHTGLVTAHARGATLITAASGSLRAIDYVSVGAATVQWSLGAGQAGVTTTVAAGTPVRWHAVDTSHTVNATVAVPPDATSIPQGATSDPQVFTAPGRYTYRCAIHPSMTGEVIVQ